MLIAAGFFVAAIRPAAAEIPLPSVSFIGEGTPCIEAGGNRDCYVAKIYYTPQRFRVDLALGAARVVALYDLERKSLTTINFETRAYVVEPFDPKNDDLKVFFVVGRGAYTRVGEEAIGGTPTVKYKLTEAQDGMRSEVFVWVGADNIVRRIAGTTTGEPNVGDVVTKFDVTKILTGSFDSKWLDVAIPSDFKKVDP
jgi:hypothetical protein